MKIPTALLLCFFTLTTFAAPNVAVELVQYPIEGKRTVEQFWKKVEASVAVAVRRHADVVAFPELISLDLWPLGTAESKDERAVLAKIASESDAIAKRAGALAAKHRILLIAGSTPRKVGDKLFNSLVIADASGKVMFQDKTHLTRWERNVGFSEGTTIVPIAMPWGNLVALICYDSEIPGISQQLAALRPEVILVLSMTDDDAGRQRVKVAAQARSVEHLAYVGLTGTVGKPSKTFTNEGQAIFFAPPVKPFRRYVLKEGPLNRPGSVFQSLDLGLLREARKDPAVYPARDQHPIEVGP